MQAQTPPINEWIIIKAIYTNPQHLVNVAEQIDIRDFTYRPFRIIYTAIKQLAASGTAVNSESIMALLQSEQPAYYQEIDAIGGTATLDTLYDPQYRNMVGLDEHIRSIRDRADNQNIINAADELKRRIEDGDANELALEEFDKSIQAIKLRGRQQDVKPVGHSIDDLLSRIVNQDEDIVGVNIGKKYPKLDRMIRHIQPKRVTIFLSNYKSGKSTVLLELAWYMASECNVPTLFGDTELFDSEVQTRLLAKVSGFPMEYILSGHWNTMESHRNIILNAKEKIKQTPFYWHNTNHMSRSQIVSLVKLCQLKYGIQVFAYDYIKPDIEDDINARVDLQIGAKVDMLKESIAKACNIAVLSAIQMNEDTGRAANSKEGERLADNVIVLRRTKDEDDMPFASHLLWLKTSRYTQANVTVPLDIDFGTQKIEEK
ncbi:DnaB-like helicase C-terminal domain-containing protein [Alicyclobacillus acidoterrestris]|uniref:DNA 5'-3' helicase n=1 Tax=Alicyclobacillus acidoterrestris (strain ATCC 49025 / DSM 3922 / CIP 106132 / NCIMB 13137 / GD3B) TaxID=1356854 RepID=T0DDM6_ALIAG|nr:DnaB-like helicase C-terminal domain-containing protein [Alicyclobacillus acidoterrestris]EPZ47761.1 hypothetical protein N007_05770 [Alicyclobacillus acidoterrestris ATCC 49025]UNO47934.1 replicative DNA helicase [Alicyclobacillus acidoterrestris]